uniref:Uncharacterized protein n=1 Tax=Anguilla anguilla TaxID=7936 RepID=A0A0E9V5W6_ANGAN
MHCFHFPRKKKSYFLTLGSFSPSYLLKLV